ncbi:uncharacterized protein [Trachinotus anak]|uniref:uncharacterized protein n=1 Tax=Trachinotus anak TaxID=443729 RepID=UPI0039F1C56D
MEEPQTNDLSEGDASVMILRNEDNSMNTPVTILQGESSSEVTMDRPQTTKPNDPSDSGCESTTKAEGEDPLRLFVTLLTVKVLTKCQAVQNCSQEKWINHTKRLVNQTMEGIAITEGFCPDVKHLKKVCKAVMKDLEKKFCGRRLLESVILLEDPAIDTVIVHSLQAHIKNLSAELAKKASPESIWKTIFQVTACIAGLIGSLFLLLLIP